MTNAVLDEGLPMGWKRTAFHAPSKSAYAGRWVLSIKSECLDRMILFGGASLR
jgi:hypothetical protein